MVGARSRGGADRVSPGKESRRLLLLPISHERARSFRASPLCSEAAPRGRRLLLPPFLGLDRGGGALISSDLGMGSPKAREVGVSVPADGEVGEAAPECQPASVVRCPRGRGGGEMPEAKMEGSSVGED